MYDKKTKQKFKEWFARYVLAEVLGTILAICFAYAVYTQTKSYAVAAGAGFLGEGIGFYGYFIFTELIKNKKKYKKLPIISRFTAIISKSSTNLIIEFAPAEIIDNLFIRPFLMFYVPQHIEPYILGFLIGKLIADALFYIFAIAGYETKKRLQRWRCANKRLLWNNTYVIIFINEIKLS